MPLSRNGSTSKVSELSEGVVQVEMSVETQFDVDLDSSFDLGFEFGDSNSFDDGVQVQEEKPSATRRWSSDYVDELL